MQIAKNIQCWYWFLEKNVLSLWFYFEVLVNYGMYSSTDCVGFSFLIIIVFKLNVCY